MTMSLRERWFRYSKCAEAVTMSLHEPFVLGFVIPNMPQTAVTMSLREPWFRYSKCAEALTMSLHEP